MSLAEIAWLEFLDRGFMRHALLATVPVAVVAPMVGTFVVQRRQSLIGDGIGHVAFAGVGLGFLFDFDILLGATILSLLAAVLLPWLQRSGLSGDLSLAMIFYGGIALGYFFMHRSGIGINNALGVLFGSPLNLSFADAATIAGLAGGVLLLMAVFYRPLVAIAFDEAAARVSGIHADRLVLTLTVIVALVVVGGMYTIGILLVAGLMVVPVAAASQLSRSYRGTMLGAAAIGGGCALFGLVFAYYADETPGSSIVLGAIACYVLAVLIRLARDRVRREIA
ncbi:metal ABC transporter permease [Egibacter rhizosphaerae]|nr:metal ABC transporter permease [Egibacter rhizosphaerae]